MSIYIYIYIYIYLHISISISISTLYTPYTYAFGTGLALSRPPTSLRSSISSIPSSISNFCFGLVCSGLLGASPARTTAAFPAQAEYFVRVVEKADGQTHLLTHSLTHWSLVTQGKARQGNTQTGLTDSPVHCNLLFSAISSALAALIIISHTLSLPHSLFATFTSEHLVQNQRKRALQLLSFWAECCISLYCTVLYHNIPYHILDSFDWLPPCCSSCGVYLSVCKLDGKVVDRCHVFIRNGWGGPPSASPWQHGIIIIIAISSRITGSASRSSPWSELSAQLYAYASALQRE